MTLSGTRSSSEILEMISAAETLVLLSNASYWSFLSNVSPCPRKKKAVTFRLPSSNSRRPRPSAVAAAKYYKVDDDVDDDDYVPQSTSSSSPHSRSRKKRKPNANDVKFPAPSSSHCYHVSDELETFTLPLKKRKRVVKSEEDCAKQIYSTNNVKKNTVKKQPDQGPIPPPDMPDNVKSVVHAMGGTGLVLIIQKLLTATDVKDHQNRLQIPFSQVASKEFLTYDEKQYLNERDENHNCNCIETPLLDPAMNPHTIKLRTWAMGKSSGAKSSQVYALTKPWIKIVRDNRLREGDVVQVWGFRVGQQLQMALVKL